MQLEYHILSLNTGTKQAKHLKHHMAEMTH